MTLEPGSWLAREGAGNLDENGERVANRWVVDAGDRIVALTPDVDLYGKNRMIAEAMSAIPDARAALGNLIEAYEEALTRLAELGQGFGPVMSRTVLPEARAALARLDLEE